MHHRFWARQGTARPFTARPLLLASLAAATLTNPNPNLLPLHGRESVPWARRAVLLGAGRATLRAAAAASTHTRSKHTRTRTHTNGSHDTRTERDAPHGPMQASPSPPPHARRAPALMRPACAPLRPRRAHR